MRNGAARVGAADTQHRQLVQGLDLHVGADVAGLGFQQAGFGADRDRLRSRPNFHWNIDSQSLRHLDRDARSHISLEPGDRGRHFVGTYWQLCKSVIARGGSGGWKDGSSFRLPRFNRDVRHYGACRIGDGAGNRATIALGKCRGSKQKQA